MGPLGISGKDGGGGCEPSRTGEEGGAASSEGSGEYSYVSLREGGGFGLIVGYQ